MCSLPLSPWLRSKSRSRAVVWWGSFLTIHAGLAASCAARAVSSWANRSSWSSSTVGSAGNGAGFDDLAGFFFLGLAGWRVRSGFTGGRDDVEAMPRFSLRSRHGGRLPR